MYDQIEVVKYFKFFFFNFLVTPNIPVVSVSIEDARMILSNYTYSGNVSAGSNKDYWFGLPLKSNSNDLKSDYKATVIVNHSAEENVTLNNILASIPGSFKHQNTVYSV